MKVCRYVVTNTSPEAFINEAVNVLKGDAATVNVTGEIPEDELAARRNDSERAFELSSLTIRRDSDVFSLEAQDELSNEWLTVTVGPEEIVIQVVS